MLGPGEHNTPYREPSFSASPAQLGVWVALGSLSVLFGSSLVAYLITRHESPNWRSVETSGAPLGLFASTLFILVTSFALHYALRAIRKNQFSHTTNALKVAALFAVAFLLGQLHNWQKMWEVHANAPSLYAFTFYMLTALHAVHVLGGFVPLGVVLLRSSRREYSSSRSEGIFLCLQYWDFLSVVWILILTALFVFD